MSTATATAYLYGVNVTRPFCASKRKKAQKSSGFRANSTYRHCIKDNVLIDFACGTGVFLVSALNALYEDAQKSNENREIYNNSVYGVEKKALPHILCVTNMLLHDIDNQEIIHGNALETDYKEYRRQEKFDVVLMNPPYGGNEKDSVKANFPMELRSSETADLFMDIIMFRLKSKGRCAIIIPDGFLFGTDNAKVNIKTKLLTEFDLHTVVRMPSSVFAPYTNITTNILFFDNTCPTKETWFYRIDMPEEYKHFFKNKTDETGAFRRCFGMVG